MVDGGKMLAALAVLIAEAAGMIMNIYWSRDIIKLKDIFRNTFRCHYRLYYHYSRMRFSINRYIQWQYRQYD